MESRGQSRWGLAGRSEKFGFYSERGGRSQRIFSRLTSHFRPVRDLCSCCVQERIRQEQPGIRPCFLVRTQARTPKKSQQQELAANTAHGVILLIGNVLTGSSMEKKLFSCCPELGDGKWIDCSRAGGILLGLMEIF